MSKVDPNFVQEVKKLGAFDISACFNCGECTALCPLSKEGNEFPRKMIRYSILGLKDKILSSTEPWLCYYCGDCTKTCPKQADPGGLMMALRRYLTTMYDWTGLSKLLYFSKKAEVIAIASIAAVVGLIIYFLHGPMVLGKVELETFAPINIVEPAGLIVLFVLGALILSNVYRMYRFIMRDGNGKRIKVPFKTLLISFKTMVIHFLTQMRFKDCTKDKVNTNWINHLIIVYGYAASFLLFVILLRLTLTNEPFLFVSLLSIIGIFSTVALLYGVSINMHGRIKKTQPMWKNSHSTDWMFLILLLSTVVTGVLVGIFRTFGFPLATYVTFSIHLMIAAPFLILEVPFAKWSHLMYRPFAVYFAELKEKALKNENPL